MRPASTRIPSLLDGRETGQGEGDGIDADRKLLEPIEPLPVGDWSPAPPIRDGLWRFDGDAGPTAPVSSRNESPDTAGVDACARAVEAIRRAVRVNTRPTVWLRS